MPQIDRVISKGQLTHLTFEQADVAASQTAVALATSEVRDTAASASDQNAAVGYCIPFGYEIVGISVTSSAARTMSSPMVPRPRYAKPSYCRPPMGSGPR